MGLWRALFGPSQAEAWQELSRQINGRFEKGGWFRTTRVTAGVDPWIMTLDTYSTGGEDSTTYTRLRAPFRNLGQLRFQVYRKSLFSGLGKLLGMQDIEIGEPIFDDDFIIKSNNEDGIRRLLADETIRRLLERQPRVHFRVKDGEGWFGRGLPEGVDELYFEAVGVIKDLDQLRGLYDLFAATLKRLGEIGSARAQNPGVALT